MSVYESGARSQRIAIDCLRLRHKLLLESFAVELSAMTHTHLFQINGLA